MYKLSILLLVVLIQLVVVFSSLSSETFHHDQIEPRTGPIGAASKIFRILGGVGGLTRILGGIGAIGRINRGVLAPGIGGIPLGIGGIGPGIGGIRLGIGPGIGGIGPGIGGIGPGIGGIYPGIGGIERGNIRCRSCIAYDEAICAIDPMGQRKAFRSTCHMQTHNCLYSTLFFQTVCT